MPTPLVSKLLTLGLTALMGGAGLTVGPSVGASILERPAAPTQVSVAALPTLPVALTTNAGIAPLLASVDPALLADPQVAALLNDPQVLAALQDPAVLQAISTLDPALLTRPAVLEALRTRQISPSLLADPVVSANLPAILAALPTLTRAFEGVGLPSATTASLPAPAVTADATPIAIPGAAPIAAPTRAQEAHTRRVARREARRAARANARIETHRVETPAIETPEARSELVLSDAARLVFEGLGALVRESTSANDSRSASR